MVVLNLCKAVDDTSCKVESRTGQLFSHVSISFRV